MRHAELFHDALPLNYDHHPDDAANEPRTAADWAALAGRYKADRHRLLATIRAGVEAKQPMAAWYELRAIARFCEEHE